MTSRKKFFFLFIFSRTQYDQLTMFIFVLRFLFFFCCCFLFFCCLLCMYKSKKCSIDVFGNWRVCSRRNLKPSRRVRLHERVTILYTKQSLSVSFILARQSLRGDPMLSSEHVISGPIPVTSPRRKNLSRKRRK